MKKNRAMKKNTMKKLRLHRETLRQLEQPEISQVRGGTGSMHDDCTGIQCFVTNSVNTPTCNTCATTCDY